MAQEFVCPKCGRATWKSYWAMLGHSGRCRGIPGLVDRLGKVQATPPPSPSADGSENGSSSGSGPTAPAAPTGAFLLPPWAPPPLDSPTAHLLEARIAALERENKVLAEILTNDLQHLGAQQQATSSIGPWLVVGGIVLLVAVAIFTGSEDDAGGAALGDPEPRPRAPLAGGLVGKLVDRAATRMIDKALGKIF